MPNVGKILNTVSEAKKLSRPYIGVKLAPKTVELLYNLLRPLLFKNASKEQSWALWTLFKPLANRVLTQEHIVSLVCRALTFQGYIRAGMEPPLWEGDKVSATFCCTGIRPEQTRKGKQYYKVYLACIDGLPSGLYFEVVLSSNLMAYILGKYLGISFKAYNSPAEELAGCIFTADVKEDVYKTELSNYKASAKMKEHNKKLAERRISPVKCKQAQIPCASCKKTRLQCPLAVWK